MHLDKNPRKLYTVQTEGGGHSDGAGATLMSTTHLCLKTYYVRNRCVVVKAYVVPGLKYDL